MHRRGVSRSSYPSFLSVPESLRLQVRWAGNGLFDAFRWDIVVSKVIQDSEIRANMTLALLLNSLLLISIYAFDLLLSPLVRNQQKWLHRNVGLAYQVFWLLPVVGVSFYLNSSWCTTIAKKTFTLRHGNRYNNQQQRVTYTGMLSAIATSAYRVVMVFTSLVISFVLAYVPYAGPLASFLFLCYLDSYYCWEFVWIARGLSLSRRVKFLETRWAYYLAFGFPLAALCTWSNSLANTAIFALLLPSYIIMAMHGQPVPADPYNPGPNSQEEAVFPSPFIPIRLPIFAPVMYLNDLVVQIFSVRNLSRARAFSDPNESVEEGAEPAHEIPTIRNSSISQRTTIGRRKLD